ncbi:MAG: creatininase [Magnetovibrio sp.]|nr:creatininase [Magnetovibrio sp.]
MRLSHSTWLEVESYLGKSDGIIIPLGSVEQHGPIGLIGTDTLCAESIANEIGNRTGALVAPAIGYSPAGFNMAFPGTISLKNKTFLMVMEEIIDSLVCHGFRHFYFLNGHGANILPVKKLIEKYAEIYIRIKSWWEFEAVNQLRCELYAGWEGMHATPSEVAITRALFRTVSDHKLGLPEKLDEAYVKAHAGDRHSAPEDHRARFPDGRVGSHSDLGTSEHGKRFFEVACSSGRSDYLNFLDDKTSNKSHASV